MTTSAMCDNCGEHHNPDRIFGVTEPHSTARLHFCNKKCLIDYLNREWSDNRDLEKLTDDGEQGDSELRNYVRKVT